MRRRRQRGSQGLVQYALILVLLVGGFALLQYLREAPERERAAAEQAAKRQAAAQREAERKAAQRAQAMEAQRRRQLEAQRQAQAARDKPAPAPTPSASIAGGAASEANVAPPSAPAATPAVSDWLRATLAPNASLDLESGAQTGVQANQRDLWWRSRAADAYCLCPYPSGVRFRFARIDAGTFAAIDARGLAALDYAIDGFKRGEPGEELRAGLAFAVRTHSGNFAKLRVRGVDPENRIDVEWRLYRGDADGVAERVAANPSLAIVDLTQALRDARRAKDSAETNRLLERIASLAEKLPPGDLRRIETRRDLGWAYYVTGQRPQAIAAYRLAISDIERAGARVPWDLAESTFRFLGMVYRAERRDTDAIGAFERAAQIAERAKPDDVRSAGMRAMSLGRDLYELGVTQCRIGEIGAALASYAGVRKVCAELTRPASTWFCKPERLVCNAAKPPASVK